MCGICGVIPYNTRGGSYEAALSRMMSSIVHRGPDSSGTHLDDKVALGFQRLSIIDTSQLGDQPMSDETGRYWLVFNGELYNYLELRKELQKKGHQFRSKSDTEVVLRSIIEWKEESLQKFRGMYGFAFFDKLEGSTLLVRDRLGIKPLYYSESPDGVLFASEVRAIEASQCISLSVDKASIQDFLTWQSVAPPRTIFNEVKSLEPGCYLRVNGAGIKKGRYWHVGKSISDCCSIDSPREYLQEMFSETIEQHALSDVELGCFLSGGIDSTIVAGKMNDALGSLKTVSIGFDETSFNETDLAKTTAERLATHHFEHIVTKQDFLTELPNVICAMDQPSGDGINTYFVSQHARSIGITVACSGLGADEIFGGYRGFETIPGRYAFFSRHPNLTRALSSIGRVMGVVAKAPSINYGKIGKLQRYLSHTDSLEAQFSLMAEFFKTTDRRQLLQARELLVGSEKGLRVIAEDKMCSEVSLLYIENFMQNTLLPDSDIMGMRHSLEIRVPFLDHKLVEFALSLSDSAKLPNRQLKGLLKNAFSEYLHPALLQQKKRGFVFPVEKWVRDESSIFGILSSDMGQWDILNPEYVLRLKQFFTATGNSQAFKQLWLLVILLEWLKARGYSL